MNIVALDLSLTATGVASPAGTGIIESQPGPDPFARLAAIRHEVLVWVDAADLVVLEGYGFGPQRGNAARELAELGGVIRMTLHDLGFAFVDVAPASLKKYATGKGNAAKEHVLAAAIRRLGYAGHNHNEADALWLRVMALDYYGVSDRVPPMPKAHRAALEKVPWPEFHVKPA